MLVWHMKVVMKEDMKKPHRVFHNYIDLFVESARASPYIMGHIYAVAIPVLVFLAIASDDFLKEYIF